MISKKIDHAFIMAAGRGTRLMPLTKKIPKGLIKYKQSTLILFTYQLDTKDQYLQNI